MVVNLYHDNQSVLLNALFPRAHISMSNALILELEEGSMVSMRLHRGCGLYDDHGHRHTTFSGFLLYAM